MVDVHGSSAGGDVMHLICRLNWHDHLIERWRDIMGGSSLCYATTVISLATLSIEMEKITCF